MKKGGDSGKAYHVKKEQKRKKKRDKELDKMISGIFFPRGKIRSALNRRSKQKVPMTVSKD